VWGGKIDDESETPKQAAMREVREEAGFRDDRYSIKHLHQFKDGEFIFDTFLVEVDEEFEPKLDWETQDFGWFEKSKFPSNLHFGLKPLLPKLGTMATASADSATPKGDEFNLSKLRNHKLLTALHRVSAAKYSKIYHVGKLDSGKRAKPDQSLEGSGVSVSLNPNAWRKIARLSGDVYELTKANPKFLTYSNKTQATALKWSTANGYIKNAQRWTYEYFSGDLDDTVVLEFASREAAVEEAGDDLENIKEIKKGYELDKKGLAYWEKSFTSAPKADGFWGQILAIVWYAEAKGYDGVWWDEIYDPTIYSAPRGVIFQDKLSTWKIKKLKETEVPGDRDVE
jgi:hypothetical protein